MHLLKEAAKIRAALFNVQVPPTFSRYWLAERLFTPKPEKISVAVGPTRAFCLALLTAKLQATIGELGDMIGWPDDNQVVGPRAYRARGQLLAILPNILPPDDDALYRLVVEHGDFGIHNMTITSHPHVPTVTSVFDWETACIVPALLSDPAMAVEVDLVLDEEANPKVTRTPDNVPDEQQNLYTTWTNRYFEVAKPRSYTM